MSDNSTYKEEIARLKSQVAALEQLLTVHEQKVLEQSDRLDRSLAKQARRAAGYAVLGEVSLAVLGQTDPLSVYQTVAQTLVDHFNMAFARIWVLEESTNELVLQVSAGEYTHLDGTHSRVSLDSERKLAWIANGREPHITNDLLTDTRVDDKAWIKEKNMVAFAGYPLLAGNNLLGVLGMFSHKPIGGRTLPILQSFAALVGTTVNTQRLLEQLERGAKNEDQR